LVHLELHERTLNKHVQYSQINLNIVFVMISVVIQLSQLFGMAYLTVD